METRRIRLMPQLPRMTIACRPQTLQTGKAIPEIIYD